MKKSLFTISVFARLNTLRFFRDKTAMFFGTLFPLIFLFIFGSISGGSDNKTFNIAIINNSDSAFSQQYVKQIQANKIFKVSNDVKTEQAAKEKMSNSQIDGTIILPKEFGESKPGQQYPSGEVQIIYTQNNATAGQTLASILDSSLKQVNAKFIQAEQPFTVVSNQLNEQSLSAFDYTFAGLLGFSIVGLGIFGPISYFPELKKQGVLKRLHTTPIKVWQYFTSIMLSQSVIGTITISVMFLAALTVFDLNVVGSIFAIAPFVIFSIIIILGIGLAVGGWAKNERQAAPLGNALVFPMLFLSGTFFPRFLMPEWLQTLSDYLPLTPMIEGIRKIVTEGASLIELGPELALMTLWFVVIYAIAFRVFRWE